MALVLARDGGGMSPERPHVHPFFRSNTQKIESEGRSLTSEVPQRPDPPKSTPTFESNQGSHEEQVQAPRNSSTSSDPVFELEMSNSTSRVPAALSRTTTDGLVNGVSSRQGKLGVNQDTIEPQAKRRKLGLGPEIQTQTRQCTLPWTNPKSESASNDLGEEATDNKPEVAVLNSSTSIYVASLPQNIPINSESQPTKVMKLRTDGKLFSPPKKKDAAGQPAKRGRNAGSSRKTLFAVLKYGTDHQSKQTIGDTIAKILSRELRKRRPPIPESASASASIKITSATPQKKSPHPFFSGTLELHTDETRATSLNRANASYSAMTSSRQNDHLSAKVSNAPMFGTAVTRFTLPPDAKEPIWPPEGMFHVRDESCSFERRDQRVRRSMRAAITKAKESQVRMNPSEDVLERLRLTVVNTRLAEQVRQDGLAFPAPQRRIISKRDLPELLLCQLQPGRKVEAENATKEYMDKSSPPLSRLLTSLSTTTSAFDNFRCETQAWTVKYSPKSSCEVLQSQSQLLLLRDWLSGSAVHSTKNVSSGIMQKKRKSLKKRKQASELDDFIVTSEDEAAEASESATPQRQDLDGYIFTKLVPRNAKVTSLHTFTPQTLEHTKAVILCGPSGCGKTAAVHAIAQELGFEIFEINAGGRRSGRDILEKVGDMTKNHLVNQSSTQSGDEDRSADERSINVENVSEEIASGKQSTMQSFFKSEAVAKPPRAKSNESENATITTEATLSNPKVSKGQKQSLILLEEVDVLFDDDKQFWTTVSTMISTSRRRVVLTCNDESLLPTDELEDCAILRLESVPTDIAVDYLLLISAHEGHLLRRDAISSLYKQTGSDLRASIVQLNFWCQMAINDTKGGLNWMMFPQDYEGTGVQLTEQRVLSQDTLLPYMGMLGRNNSGLATTFDQDVTRLEDAANEWNFQDDECNMDHCHQALDEGVSSIADQLSLFDLSFNASSAADVLRSRPQVVETIESTPIRGYTTNPPLLHTPIGLDDRSESRTSENISLSYLAQAVLKTSFNPSHIPLAHEVLCQSILNRKRPLSEHCSFIEETLITALSPLTDILYHRLRSQTLDIAPYVRSIVSYDNALQQERARLAALLSDGSYAGKRQRTTRASRAALEGGHKANTRRERWFEIELDDALIQETAGDSWQSTAAAQLQRNTRRARWAQQAEQTDSEDELAM